MISFWLREQFVEHLEDLLKTRRLPMAGALVTFAVARGANPLESILDPSSSAPMRESIVRCRWLVTDEQRPARKWADYGNLLLGERWIPGLGSMLLGLRGMLRGSSKEENPMCTLRFPDLEVIEPLIIGIDGLVGVSLPCFRGDPGYATVYGERIVSKSDGWPGWIFRAKRDSQPDLGAPHIPFGPLVHSELRPYENGFQAVQEWFAGCPPAELPSFYPDLDDFLIVIPDTRGRLASARWEDDTLSVEIGSRSNYEKIRLRGIAETPTGKVDLPSLPAQAAVQAAVPAGALRVDLFLVDDQDILCKTTVSRAMKPAVPSPKPALSSTAEAIDYKAEEQPWMTALPEIVESSAAKARARAVDVLIVVAVKVELEAVLRRLRPPTNSAAVLKVHIETRTYYLGRLGAHDVVVTLCEMGAAGQASSALATSRSIDVWHPRAIVMPGIAFGTNPLKQRIADVLVGSKVISYEPQRVGATATLHRGPVVEAGPTLLDRFRNALGWKFLLPNGLASEMRIGLFLSGEKLIDSEGFLASLLNSFPEAIGGDMEAAGIYAAANPQKTEWIVAKAICDWADGKKGSSHQKLAAAASVSLVEHVLNAAEALSGLRQ